MELLLVVVGASIGLGSAVLVSWTNNRYERHRLRDMWKHETAERMARHNRQRLEERLGDLREHVHRIVQASATISTAVVRREREEELERMSLTLLQSTASVSVIALSLEDKRLHNAVEDLHEAQSRFSRFVVAAALEESTDTSKVDKELQVAARRVLAGAAALLHRYSELPEESYAEAMASE